MTTPHSRLQNPTRSRFSELALAGRSKLGIWSLVLSLLFVFALGDALQSQPSFQTRRVTWPDLVPFHGQLTARGLSAAGFAAAVDRMRAENARRVIEGDIDHLIFYVLQSTRFTGLPPIEPALSAKALVERLDPESREQFLRAPKDARIAIDESVQWRIRAFLRAPRTTGPGDGRLNYFRDLVTTAFRDERTREAGLAAEYRRVMRFVYEKEFVAQKAERPAEAVADLYRTRGLSTDTAVEAGFIVHYGLGIAKSLEPDRRIRRVLIVGPGLDLAPRTALLDERPPQSYQPWAVIDALLSLNLSRADDLEVVAADINPRVVEHLRRARAQPLALTLVSEIRGSETITLSEDYRRYFSQLGRSIGQIDGDTRSSGSSGHLRKRVVVEPSIARALSAVPLDIVTERITDGTFDLVIATNILPYFDDAQLMLAMSNIAAMTAANGLFLHNEARPTLGEISTAVGLPYEHSRHATIATVRGAAPLFDSVWVHRRRTP